MAKNKDGLEAGQPVDFDTIMRVENARRQAKKQSTSETRRRTIQGASSAKEAEKAEG